MEVINHTLAATALNADNGKHGTGTIFTTAHPELVESFRFGFTSLLAAPKPAPYKVTSHGSHAPLLKGIIHYALLIPNTSYSNSGFHPISYTRTILNRILCPQIPNSAERRVLRFGAVANFKYFPHQM